MCEHICDTLVYKCIATCKNDPQCMRNCWIEHDRCAVNCPCNAECPDGCPEPFNGHPCDTWFCQDIEFIDECAAEDDPFRLECPHGDEESCEEHGCCWVPYSGSVDVVWCHYPKKIPIYP